MIRIKQDIKSNQGFSIIEMIIVLLVMAILAVFVVAFGSQKLYYADQQANMVMNIFKEAKQRSITQKETMRVEINITKRTIHLIDENDPTDAKDDTELYARQFGNPYEIVFDAAPQNIDSPPIEAVPVPVMQAKTSFRYYSTAAATNETAQQNTKKVVAGDKIATYRF